jgi:hypothetical protein
VEKKDIVALAAGILIVFILAVAIKYGGILPGVGKKSAPATPVPTAVVITPPLPQTTPMPSLVTEIPTTATPSPEPTIPDPVVKRIYYTDRPLSYPVFILPEKMEIFGGGEIPWKDPDSVPFAYIEEPRGGLTQTFSVPYGLWRMNITVDAWSRPQYAKFDMALCYASDGKVIDGMEILNRGSAYRNIQVSDADMYIIIHTQNVDRFRITFETPRSYLKGEPAF